MSYAQAMDGLHALGAELAQTIAPSPAASSSGPARRKFSLEPMRVLAAALDNPERRFPSVLIAGTNGKGSTAAMLAGILQAVGYRTGLYTSPHLSRANERIQIDRISIPDEDFARLYFRVDEVAGRLTSNGSLSEHPSYFETLTAMAFLYFAEQPVDVAVLEVGIGGRLDATNIVEPMLSVITDISLDHTEWLGNTIPAIAREKAGILRPNGVLVTLPQHPEANQALGEVATELNVTGVNAAEFMPRARIAAEEAAGAAEAYPLVLEGQAVEIRLPLAGSHQYRNSALAIAAALELKHRYGYHIPSTAVATGIANTRWPGRLEMFPSTASRCAVLFDVAHNPGGAWSLRSALGGLSTAGHRRSLLFGCLRDKAYQEMAQILFPVFDRVVVTPVHSPRSATAEELLAVAGTLGVNARAEASPEAGLDAALRETPREDLLVIAGSIYLIGPLREKLIGLGGEQQGGK